MNQDKESVKLDMRPTIVGSCALDVENYMHRRGGKQIMSVSRWEPQTELGRYKAEKYRESDGWTRTKKARSWT